MFFRRTKSREASFDERLKRLGGLGFSLARAEAGRVKITRGGCVAVVEAGAIVSSGIVLGEEMGVLADLGYQKAFQTPSGRREPALAAQLTALHAFEEDLRAALGLVSLYNESLGTVNPLHLYDRVVDRDRGVPRRPWQR